MVATNGKHCTWLGFISNTPDTLYFGWVNMDNPTEYRWSPLRGSIYSTVSLGGSPTGLSLMEYICTMPDYTICYASYLPTTFTDGEEIRTTYGITEYAIATITRATKWDITIQINGRYTMLFWVGNANYEGIPQFGVYTGTVKS